jgi:hypothetical protein
MVGDAMVLSDIKNILFTNGHSSNKRIGGQYWDERSHLSEVKYNFS